MSNQPQPGETEAARITRLWNTPRRDGGMRPDGYERYPAMLYKARRKDERGPYLCVDPHDEGWSGANQLTVRNAHEEERALDNGWRRSPQEAIDYCLALDKEISDAAAERAMADKRMSPRAQAEAAAADEATADHVPEVPEKPRARKAGKGR